MGLQDDVPFIDTPRPEMLASRSRWAGTGKNVTRATRETAREAERETRSSPRMAEAGRAHGGRGPRNGKPMLDMTDIINLHSSDTIDWNKNYATGQAGRVP